MSLASWTAALRIARRETRRGKLRSLLVVALIGLPVLILAGVDVLYQTYTLPADEQVSRDIGAADAQVQWIGALRPDAAPPTTAALAGRLPAGARLIVDRTAADLTRFVTPDGLGGATLHGFAYADPLARGIVRQDAGRAPRNAGEVAVSRQIAANYGLGVGDTLRTVAPERRYRVVGVVTPRDAYGAYTLYTVPSAVPESAPDGVSTTTWLVDTPGPVDPTLQQRLLDAGFDSLTRADLADAGPTSTGAIATGTLVGGMVLLEIVLLAGPAFAVGARTRRRELALLAAVGGDRAALRRVVLADAVVLGLGAGVVGVLGGVGLAALGEGWTVPLARRLPGEFTVPYLHLAGLVVVSVATAMLAALVPAIRAARADVVAALAGRQRSQRIRLRVPIAGLAVAAVGAALTPGELADPSANVVLTGVALIELGLVVATPTVIALVALLARRLPLSGRIALRDASRNRTAAAPAVAAVMASVIGAMAAVIGTSSGAEQDRREYRPLLPQRDSYVALPWRDDAPAAIAQAMRAVAPGQPVTTLQSTAGNCDVPGHTHQDCVEVASSPPRRTGRAPLPTNWYGALPTVLVDDGTALDAVLGHHDAAALAALRSGRALVADATALLPGGRTVRVEVNPVSYSDSATTDRPRRRVLPAQLITGGFRGFDLILPPSALPGLGVTAAPAGVLLTADTPLSSTQQQRLNLAVAGIAPQTQATVEAGWSDSHFWLAFTMVAAAAAIAVLATLVATALANVDSRGDLVLLGAVGASPRTRRVLSFARAAVIAGVGTVIGALAGILPARAWARAVGAPLVIPWATVAVAVVGIPLLAALLAGLFSRARLPSERPA